MAVDSDAYVDLREVENGLRRMQRAGHDLLPVFRRARDAMRRDQAEHQKEQRGPDGAWQALAESTISKRRQRTGKQGRKRKRRLKSRALRKLGRLPKAYKIEISPSKIVQRSTVAWSYVHQDGGIAGRRSIIPMRKFFYASGKLLATVARLAVDHLVGAWDK